MGKRFYLLLMISCLCLYVIKTPVMASSSVKVSPEVNRPMPQPCKCQRPFKRLIAAMEDLKKSNCMTESEFKKAFDTLMEIPKQAFKDSSDMDQTAADTLYKGKVFTPAQYKKICEFLKSHPAH